MRTIIAMLLLVPAVVFAGDRQNEFCSNRDFCFIQIDLQPGGHSIFVSDRRQQQGFDLMQPIQPCERRFFHRIITPVGITAQVHSDGCYLSVGFYNNLGTHIQERAFVQLRPPMDEFVGSFSSPAVK